MRFARALFAVMLAALVTAGCSDPAAKPTLWEPTAAQPRLATTNLWLGPAAILSLARSPAERSLIKMDPALRKLTAEMALTPREIAAGMMFRTNLVEHEGMIFHLGIPQRASFWMKNCPKPLSCAYIDPQGVILEIRDMEPNNTNSVVANFSNVLFVLETTRGWFERHGVQTGMVVQTESGPLIETIPSRLPR